MAERVWSSVGLQGGSDDRRRRAIGFLSRVLFGLLLGTLVYGAIEGLPSALSAVQRLGFLQDLAISPAALRLSIGVLITVLYAALPFLGGLAALIILVLPVAQLNWVLVGVYLMLSLLSLPCLYKTGGVFLIALIPMAVVYPGMAVFTPLIPVVAGALYGKILGPYVSAFAAVLLILAVLVSGQAVVGGVYVGGDQNPMMMSENIVEMEGASEEIGDFLSEFLSKFGYKFGWEALDSAGIGHLQKIQFYVQFFFIMGLPLLMQIFLPLFVVSNLLVLAEILGKLSPLVLAQVGLWGTVGFGVAWLARKRSTGKTVLAAIYGVGLVVAGHLVLLRVSDLTLPVSFFMSAGVVSAGAAAVLAAVIVRAQGGVAPSPVPSGPIPATLTPSLDAETELEGIPDSASSIGGEETHHT